MGAYYSIKDNGMLSDKDVEVFVLRCSTRWLWCMKKAGFGARTAGQARRSLIRSLDHAADTYPAHQKRRDRAVSSASDFV
jgi:hypothetical protein